MMVLAMVMLITSTNSLSVIHQLLNNYILRQIVEHVCISNFYPIADNLYRERIKLMLRRLESLQEYPFLHAFYVYCLSTSSRKEVSVFFFFNIITNVDSISFTKMLFDLDKILGNEYSASIAKLSYILYYLITQPPSLYKEHRLEPTANPCDLKGHLTVPPTLFFIILSYCIEY